MRYARINFYPSDFCYAVVGPEGIDARKWGGQFCQRRRSDGTDQWYEFTESELKCAAARVVYEWKPVEAPHGR